MSFIRVNQRNPRLKTSVAAVAALENPRLKSSTLKSSIRIFTIVVCVIGSCSFAAEKDAGFEGTVSASLTRAGTDTTQFLYTPNDNQLRIENVDKSRP